MHMVSKRDLHSAELETMRTSRSPTTVLTANGEVQTREEATVHVKELDLFVTVMLLEETPAVLSLGKLCEDHGYTYHWTSGQKTHLTKKGKRIDCNISNYVPFVVSGLSPSSSTTPTPCESQHVFLHGHGWPHMSKSDDRTEPPYRPVVLFLWLCARHVCSSVVRMSRNVSHCFAPRARTDSFPNACCLGF